MVLNEEQTDCDCSTGYHLVKPNTCEKCENGCKTCKDGKTCVDCNNHRELDEKKLCDCVAGYSEVEKDGKCLECDVTCEKCSGPKAN